MNLLTKFTSILQVSFLILFAVFPSEFLWAKLFVISVLAIWSFLFINLRFNLNLIIILIFYVAFFIISFVSGYFSGFSLDTSVFYSYLFPIVVTFLFYETSRIVPLNIDKIVRQILSLIVTVNLLYIFQRLGYIDIIHIESSKLFGSTKYDGEILEFRLLNQNALIFFSVFFIWSRINLKINNYDYLLIFLTILIVFLSGRRALQILFLINLIFFTVYKLYRSAESRDSRFIFVTIFIVFFFLYILTKLGIDNIEIKFWNTLSSAFSDSIYSSVREQQISCLLPLFDNSPVIGNGATSHCNFIRNSEYKWSYEYVYLAYLAQNGVLGFSFIIFLFLYPFKSRAKHSFSYVFATLSFFVAGATNPMISSIWFWSILYSKISYEKKVNT